MSKTIDITERRNQRDIGREHICRDERGRPMYEYLIEYEFEGKTLSDGNIWAYSEEDAERRIAAIRSTLELKGQLFGVDAS